MNKFLQVVFEKDEDGYIIAEVPEIKGCYTQERKIENAVRKIEEVIDMCTKTQQLTSLPTQREYLFNLKDFSKALKDSRLTAIIKFGEKQFVAKCPELDVVSQGKNIEIAIKNLIEAVQLFQKEKRN